MKILSKLCFILLSVSFSAIAIADPADAFVDPEQAGPAYALQGEYKGPVDIGSGEEQFGVQVIALGDGKFRLIAYQGGLPGDGWTRDDQRMTGEGEISDGGIVAIIESAEITIADGAMTVTTGGQTIGLLQKIERKSPTLGQQPAEGALVLFDGHTAEHFENGKIVEEKLLAATNAISKEKFGDHHMHIEFRTPFMPAARGQGRGNSGVYVQGRYEVQVLDSFGLEGKDNECGGIYSIAEPIVNMCLPPLAWQTYDIEFIAAKYDSDGNKTDNARITVHHNGVVIHDDLELTHHTPGYQSEGPDNGSLFLQDHGNPVVFRNIWVARK